MPSLPVRLLPRKHQFRAFFSYIYHSLNFFRVHLLVFTFVPIILAAILYASNGQNHISYIDALFTSISSMQVCGLATVDLSLMTNWQQGILFIQMCIGSPVVVSWVMVVIRRHFMAKELTRKMQQRREERIAAGLDPEAEIIYVPWWKELFLWALPRKSTASDEESDASSIKEAKRGRDQRLRTDMIRRTEGAPQRVTPSGFLSETTTIQESIAAAPAHRPPPSPVRQLAFAELPTPADLPEAVDTSSSTFEDEDNDSITDDVDGRPAVRSRPTTRSNRRLSDPGTPQSASGVPVNRYQTINLTAQPMRNRGPSMTRTQTVEFAPDPRGHQHQRMSSVDRGGRPRGASMTRRQPTLEPVVDEDLRSQTSRPQLSMHPSISSRSHHNASVSTRHQGLGGFPMPHEMISSLVHHFFPSVEQKLKRTVTVPMTRTITSQHLEPAPGARTVPYISFEAVVGRNSTFHLLTSEQIEELCGVEFKALNALLWIVPLYHIGVQLIAFTVIVSYMSTDRWAEDFQPPALHQYIAPPWFALFQTVSAYTNTGTSLVDQSMVPFQRAYPMILIMAFIIIAGNTGFPVLLRFMIWTITKIIPKKAKLQEPLHFLLDHPRRCFIYLFPSHQTWFLLTVVVSLTFTDWFFFLVLDIGNKELAYLPVGVKFIVGLLQATAVRAAGFATVSIMALAPAVKVLYLLMMYVSVYPIAMSVRSTNVYEEKSLGLFNDDEDDESVDDETFTVSGPPVMVWSRYLALHMRKQLTFDMWWIALALFLVCIIERDGLDVTENASWFNIFSILFELVSAYGTVGLSLGLPTANYSFSGALKPLSKLIICLVMIRGRHRGLPVAIDRAVMLPDIQAEDARSLRRRMSQMGDGSTVNYSGYGGAGNAAGDGISMHFTSTIPGSNHERDSVFLKEGSTRNVENSPGPYISGDGRTLADEKAVFSPV